MLVEKCGYIDRLSKSGLSLCDAKVIVNDFFLQNNEEGLESYCKEAELVAEARRELDKISK